MELDQTHEIRELALLEHIESDPDITQANLADKLGIAVGTVNWHLKRLIAKGYVKAQRAQRKKLLYIITPEGLTLRAKLTVKYVENQMKLYRQTRHKVKELLEKVKETGYSKVIIAGEGEIAEVCQLTCLELGITVVEDGMTPKLLIEGYDIKLDLGDK